MDVLFQTVPNKYQESCRSQFTYSYLDILEAAVIISLIQDDLHAPIKIHLSEMYLALQLELQH